MHFVKFNFYTPHADRPADVLTLAIRSLSDSSVHRALSIFLSINEGPLSAQRLGH
jgi:hypothetical protein